MGVELDGVPGAFGDSRGWLIENGDSVMGIGIGDMV